MGPIDGTVHEPALKFPRFISLSNTIEVFQTCDRQLHLRNFTSGQKLMLTSERFVKKINSLFEDKNNPFQ